MAKSTILKVKNITGATIAAGKAVYISGFDTTDSVATVALASNDAVDKMPAVGLVAEEIPNNEVGTVRVSGAFSPIDTTAGYVNAPVFIGRNGGLVFSDPTAGRPPKVVDEDEDEDDNVTSSSTAFKLGKVSAPRTATNRPVKVTSARSRSISRNLDSTAQQIGVVMSVGSSGSIQLFPLEIKNRIKHDDIIDVKTDQHHRKKHAAAHYKNGSDPIKHGSLADLNKDAHTQYILVNGSRAFTGTVSGITPTADTHLATKAYVDAIVTGGAATQFVSQTTFQENKNAQYQINQSIIQALDGYLTIASSGVSELTFSENKNSQYQVNQSILQSLDGYITIADLSGYTTDAEFTGLDQTVTEHYNQLTQIIQDMRSAADGYAQDSTVTEHYNQLTQIIQDVRSATDGYATDAEFAELTLTFEENKSAQFEINQVIIQALDGYDVTIQENKSAQQQINQTILQAIDGYVIAPQVGFGVDGQIAFFVGDNLHIEGESQLFWDRTNNYLGVGTSTPVVKLEVTESIDSNTANLANSHASFSQTVLRLGTVRANNNTFGFIAAATSTDADAIGGTTIFHVKGDAQTVIGPASSLMTSRLQVNTDSTYTGTSQVFGGLYAGSDIASAQAVLRKTRGTIASPTVVSSGDKIGTLAFQAYDGASIQNAAYIEAIVDGTPSAGDMPGRLSLWTTPDGSATSQERLRIWNGGQISVPASDSFFSSRSAALEVLTYASSPNGPQGLSLFHAETGANGPSLNLRHTRGTHGSPTIVAVDDQIGGLFFQGYTGTGFQNGAAILSYIDATPGATDMPGRLSFLTTPDGSTTVTERMRISNNGNIRIGDSGAGASLLEANRSTNGGEYIRIINTNVGVNATAATIVSSNAAGLQLMALGSGYTFTQLGNTTAGRAVISTDSGSSAGLHIGTEHASAPLVFATAGVSRATIDASGNAFFYKNVGIGGDIINKHLSETFLTIRVALDGYAVTTNEIKSAQDQINQTIIQALDGYAFSTNEIKSAQDQINQSIIQALDGYAFTTNEIKSAQDQINQTIIQALDGYNADITSLNNTVTEHYNQLSQNVNDVISVIDGYATDTEFTGLTLTVEEHKAAQYQINQSVIQALDGYQLDYTTVMEEPTGFVNTTDSVISFDDGTLTFSIAPALTSFDYYIIGTKYTVTTTKTVTISDVEGIHFIYFNGSTLSETTTFSYALYKDYAIVSIVYWDATNNEHIYLANERHGLVMDWATHLYLHQAFGAQYISGLSIGNITIGDGDLDTHAELSVSNGTIRDEDLFITITDGAPQDLSTIAQIPVLYRTGATGYWRLKTVDNFPIIYSGTAGYTGANGRIPFNEFSGGTWQLTQVNNNDCVLVHILATNDVEYPIIAIQGQHKYENVTDARRGATVFDLSGLPFAEFVPIGAVIFQSVSTLLNTPKARIVQDDLGNDYIDLRTIRITASGNPQSHASLSNLSFDLSNHSGFQRSTFVASVAPTELDDGYSNGQSTTNFDIGSFWIDISSKELYVLKNNHSMLAEWERMAVAGDLDGYATSITVVENLNAQQQINQSILQSLDGYAQNVTVTEHYSQLSQNINDIVSIIDGYATDIEFSGLALTVEENKSAQQQINQTITQSLDGYAITINEIKTAQDQINQSIIQSLDGYVVELTFQENKNFQELVNQRTVQALDGYAITINEIKSAQDQINQSILQSLDGYVIELTFQENKNAQYQINQTILQALDGYITAAASGVSEQTFQENKNSQEQINQSILQALDGYDLAIQENKSAQYQVNQSIIQALDGYGAGTGNGNVSGSGIDGYVAYWNGTESITGSGDFYYNYEDGYLGLGTDAPNARLTVNGVISIMPVQAAPLEEDNFGKLYMDNSGDLFYLRSDGEKINLTLRIIDGGPFVI